MTWTAGVVQTAAKHAVLYLQELKTEGGPVKDQLDSLAMQLAWNYLRQEFFWLYGEPDASTAEDIEEAIFQEWQAAQEISSPLVIQLQRSDLVKGLTHERPDGRFWLLVHLPDGQYRVEWVSSNQTPPDGWSARPMPWVEPTDEDDEDEDTYIDWLLKEWVADLNGDFNGLAFNEGRANHLSAWLPGIRFQLVEG